MPAKKQTSKSKKSATKKKTASKTASSRSASAAKAAKTGKKSAAKKTSTKKTKPKVRVSRVKQDELNANSVVDLKGQSYTEDEVIDEDLLPKEEAAASGQRDHDKDLAEIEAARQAVKAVSREDEEEDEEEITEEPGDRSAGAAKKKEPMAKPKKKPKASYVDEDEELDAGEEVDDLYEEQPEKTIHKPSSFKEGKIYKRLAAIFIVLTIILVATIAYFTVIKTTITVSLMPQERSGSLEAVIYDRGSDYVVPEEAARGLVDSFITEQSKIYPVEGDEIIGQEVVGTVTIVNNSIKNQPLVATTRLLSTGRKLFRLKESVNVPAGSSIEAEVYADEPSPEMVVGKEHFTIPGLWEGLQDDIYATSEEGDIKYQKQVRTVIDQNDLDKAKEDLKAVLLAKAKADVDNTFGDYNQKFYSVVDGSLEYDFDGQLGDEKDELMATVRGEVVVVAFNDEKLQDLARAKLQAELAESQDLESLRPDSISYELAKTDLDNKSAVINMTYQGLALPTSVEAVIDKTQLVNLSKEQLTKYLESKPELRSFTVDFYPPFIQSTPGLADRIEIKVFE